MFIIRRGFQGFSCPPPSPLCVLREQQKPEFVGIFKFLPLPCEQSGPGMEERQGDQGLAGGGALHGP